MSKAETFYSYLPGPLQNVALSFYGLNQHIQRFGGKDKSAMEDTNIAIELDSSKLKELQDKRLRRILLHANECVPYYQELFQKLDLNINEVNIDNYTDILPVLDKKSVIANHDKFVSIRRDGKSVELFTSGTSGSPIRIIAELNARRLNYAYYANILKRAGASYLDRSVIFAGRTLVANEERKTFWRKDYINKTLYCSSYQLAERNLLGYVRAIEQWSPLYIDAYPSAIAAVAQFINQNKIRHKIQPKFILTSSESLQLSQEVEIVKAFNCKIIDSYGCTEMAVMATRFDEYYYPEAGYGLIEYHPLETVDEEQEQNYELVCTGLLNAYMPLIRYKIGDLVAGVEIDCRYPFQKSRFSQIIGRRDDLIVTPEGYKIGRMDPVFKGVTGIKEAQIIQHRLDQLEVLIVLSDDASNRSDMESLLANNIKRRTSNTMKVQFKYATEIQKSKNGKFKAVVSEVDKCY